MAEAGASPTVRVLVICNSYPSDRALYRNGFIHRRVKAYVDEGIGVEVFYNHQPVKDPYVYEFDGIQVTVGDDLALEDIVKTGEYDAFLVHFPEPTRIDPLRRAKVAQPIIAWIHGFEAEAWYRRWFNFIDSAEAVEAALRKKDEYYNTQNSFLAELMREDDLDVSFVNVSEWFQRYIVEPDVHAEFGRSEVIHNLVDEEVFPYREKTTDMRLKFLSIRPYASMKYANDQTVDAIVELSTRPYFDQLEFTICGQGKLFDETVAPLKAFDNVKLHNKFFSQEQIAKLHAQHGVFLCPTRFDSQGVSMCEAVSSGLVAITSDIAAIPEFISDHETGLLATPEDPESIADLIEEIYFDEELFEDLSVRGSEWMKSNCGRAATVGREIELIKSRIEEARNG